VLIVKQPAQIMGRLLDNQHGIFHSLPWVLHRRTENTGDRHSPGSRGEVAWCDGHDSEGDCL